MKTPLRLFTTLTFLASATQALASGCMSPPPDQYRPGELIGTEETVVTYDCTISDGRFCEFVDATAHRYNLSNGDNEDLPAPGEQAVVTVNLHKVRHVIYDGCGDWDETEVEGATYRVFEYKNHEYRGWTF